MIYVPLPNHLLNKHKIIANKSGILSKELLQLKKRETGFVSTKILDYILLNLEDIVGGSLEQLKKIQNDYFDLIYELDNHFKLNSRQPNTNQIIEFTNTNKKIFVIFNKAYDNFTKRSNNSWNSYEFLRELDQSVCPYCNANFIHTVQSNNHLSKASSRGMADLDHFLPKTVFPIFAISLSNLVPSCIYCNQRFKGSYYTSFNRNFSPYDFDIEDKVKFKISYFDETYKSVYEKLGAITDGGFSLKEKYYIKLISNDNHFEQIKKTIEQSKEFLVIISDQLSKLESTVDNELSDQNYSLKKFIESCKNYISKVEDFVFLDLPCILKNKENYIVVLEKEFEKLRFEREKFEKYKKKKNLQRKLVTNLKNEIKNHFNDSKKNFILNFERKINLNNTVDFVEVSLGKSLNYQIEIDTTSTNENEKYMVYNNAALFQLEAVYNEHKRYINRKIEQSYILNNLYKSQLQNQFPTLFHEHSIDNMIDLILIDKGNQRNEVLGKLVYELVAKNVKSQSIVPLLRN